MSHKLISHSPDLQQLRNEGYEIEVKHTHLLVYNIPYVNSNREIARGIIIVPLGDLAGEKTAPPTSHVVHFTGEHPCDRAGNILKGIQHSSGKNMLAEGIESDHSFSNNPGGNFPNYYEQVMNYMRIITHPAESINNSVTAKTFKPIGCNTDPDIPFRYLDANSARAGIDIISTKLKDLKIAIVGLGGTGAYVLDFVVKTPVKEIHIFDQDVFLTHNAFRSPGAPSIEILNEGRKKVSYFEDIYLKMHKYITPHDYYINSENVDELLAMNFIFICIDDGEAKKLIVDKLITAKIPFIDMGIGINEINGSLMGNTRTTIVTEQKNNHVGERIHFAENANNDYNKNIQIAEINALNAAFAVMKWKKMFGFYHDLEKEHHSTYDIGTNKIFNDEIIS